MKIEDLKANSKVYDLIATIDELSEPKQEHNIDLQEGLISDRTLYALSESCTQTTDKW